jgi:hypothetical protein
MSMKTEFNPIDYALRLESEGVPANQANVHAKALADALATCTVQPQDLLELGNSFNIRMIGLDNSVLALRKDTERGLTEVMGKIDKLQVQITMLKWMLGFMVVLQSGILLKMVN